MNKHQKHMAQLRQHVLAKGGAWIVAAVLFGSIAEHSAHYAINPVNGCRAW